LRRSLRPVWLIRGHLGALGLGPALPGVTGVRDRRDGAYRHGAGVVYLGLASGALLLRLDHGTALVLTVVFGTWASDTVAYFAGRFFGQTPMTPVLSPNKTWEGFAGGVIGTLLLVQFIGLYTVLTPLESLYLGLVIAFSAGRRPFESLIKRDARTGTPGRSFPAGG
jgi:phosphatidate cytidylyltransferase